MCVQSNEADWKKYAHFDQFKYTRNLVDDGNGKFNLLVLCWGEGQARCVPRSLMGLAWCAGDRDDAPSG